jgi:hypothetical protein
VEVKIKYIDNLKKLLKEIKDVNKCKEIPCSWFGTLNIVKMSTLLSTDSTQPLSKSQWSFFAEIKNPINFIWELKEC